MSGKLIGVLRTGLPRTACDVCLPAILDDKFCYIDLVVPCKYPDYSFSDGLSEHRGEYYYYARNENLRHPYEEIGVEYSFRPLSNATSRFYEDEGCGKLVEVNIDDHWDTDGFRVQILPESLVGKNSRCYMRYADIFMANFQGIHYLAAIDEINQRYSQKDVGFMSGVRNIVVGPNWWKHVDRDGSWDYYGEFNPDFLVRPDLKFEDLRAELLQSVSDSSIFDTIPLICQSVDDGCRWILRSSDIDRAKNSVAIDDVRKPSEIIRNLGESLKLQDVAFKSVECKDNLVINTKQLASGFNTSPCKFSYVRGDSDGVSFPTVTPACTFDFAKLGIPESNVLSHPARKRKALRNPDTNFDFDSLNQYQGAITYIELDGQRQLALIVPSIVTRQYTDTPCRDDLHVYCPESQQAKVSPTGICQVEEYGKYDVYAVDSANPVFAEKLIGELQGQDIVAIVSDDQSYSSIATSEMFMQRVKSLQRVISKHDLFGELAMEQALGTAGRLEQQFQASVDKLREVADTESEGLFRYTAEAVAKSKGEFLFDLTERVRDIQEDDQYVSTVTAAHQAREEGMTAIIKAYQESITKLRDQYEKVFDELGEIRDSEFEALASAYDEIVDAAKDEYVSYTDAEYTEKAVAEELGSSSVSDYVDSALLEGMDDDFGSSTGKSDNQFQ